MLKKWKVIAPLALSAAGALAAAAVVLLKKDPAEVPKAAAPVKGKAAAAPAKAPKAAPKNLLTGSYSFISGFQNAATVEMTLDYDADALSYAVVEEDFLSYSSDSHVAIVEGEDFRLQIEYAAFYGGEDFLAHIRHVEEKYQGFAPVRFGSVEGVQYLDGDALCFHFAIPDDSDSYLLVTVFKAPGNDAELTDLPQDPNLAALLGSIRFRVSR